jgi:1,5-anhydro-D-fructose reductase (1,5-anhydro-D-mannitol-forming)
MLSWAVVGTGTISDIRIAPALKKSKINRLTAAVSRDEERAAEFARKHGAEKGFDSFADMLKDPRIDVVYLGTPNALHATQTIASCRAGKHVFCDKPMALTVADCQAMIQAADEHSVKLGIGFNNRYNPAHQEAKRRLDAGAIGEPLFASVHFGLKGGRVGWRLDADLAGGGAIMDMGVHAIDLLRFLLGREVVEVCAFLDTATYGWPLDQIVSAVLEFEGDIHSLFNVSLEFPYARNGVEIYGSKGALLMIDSLVSQMKREFPPPGHLEVLTDSGVERIDFETLDLYQAELDAFGDAIIRDVEPEITGIDGLRAQEVTWAAQQAATTGKAVRIGD